MDFNENNPRISNNELPLLQETLERIREDRTVLTIAHRLSTIKNAGKLYFNNRSVLGWILTSNGELNSVKIQLRTVLILTTYIDGQTSDHLTLDIACFSPPMYIVILKLILPILDQIAVLEHGRIVEKGSYNDIITNDGPFRRLIKHQAFR